jgi:hypothetical protein
MGLEKRFDPGETTAAQLSELEVTFEIADEVYRRFRTLILQDPPLPESRPIEWVPISDN